MSQERNSNSPKGGLTVKNAVNHALAAKKRSYRLFIAGLTALAVSALALSGCKDNSDPFVDPGNTPDPNWVVTVDNNMTTSMTATVSVSFAKQPGTLAAFMGNECCGVAEYKAENGLYWLYMSPATEAGGEIQLRFYSPELKRIFRSTTTFPFTNDTQLGSVSAPYTPTWTAE